MRPYENLAPRLVAVLLLLAFLVVNAGFAQADLRARMPAAMWLAWAPLDKPGPTNTAESLTRSGLDHYYNTNYDAAIKDFERVVEMRPQEPGALNHLLEAIVFRELYRAGALNTTLYSGDGFINNTRPVSIEAATRQRIKNITDGALNLCEQRLKDNPNDVQALYARGVTRGLRATYLALVDKAWFAALRSAIGARHDHQRVLELQPDFTDAKTVVGVHNYVAGSLPWAIKAAVSVVGLSGSKPKGLEYLRAAADANVETSPDAKVALALFLRREQRYKEASDVVHSLVVAYPNNFLFALEEANLLKDWGKNQEAVDAYRKLLTQARDGTFHEPRLEFPNYDLGEILRGRKEYEEAVEFYETAARIPNSSPDLRQKSALAAGEMYDVLARRDLALKQYEMAINADTSTPLADTARRHIREPYRAQ
jgi:tetratricopeptide (TPR) repeat protein